MATESDVEQRLLAAAMDLAADRGWLSVELADVAERADLTLAELYRVAPGRVHILGLLARHTDTTVLSSRSTADGETGRDRLFDLLMARFDALAPYRHGIAAIIRDLPRDPVGTALIVPQIARSMDWMVEAARLATPRLLRPGLTLALAGLWLSVLRVWLEDETADLARTMAALDARLRTAESMFGGLRTRGRGADGSGDASDAPGSVPDDGMPGPAPRAAGT